MKPKVVITHWVHPEVVEQLAASCEVVANSTREALTRGEILRRARDADALLAFMPDSVDDEFLKACPKLRVISCALKGYDNFDVDACARHGVWLTIVPDLLTIPTAELTIGLIVGLMRKVLEGDRTVRGGTFNGWRPRLYGAGLAGHTIGIIGMGAVGQAVARRLQGWDLQLLYTDPRPLTCSQEALLKLTHVSLDELLGRSDVVVPMLPLKPETLHLVNVGTLARMKPGAFLVNTGRGSVVDEEAVADALASGRLAGYGADVFELEDWARVDRPREIPRRLLDDTARTLFTPHLGSAVAEVRLAIEREAASNILQALRGEVPAGALNRPRVKA